jgi:hypothetical protein
MIRRDLAAAGLEYRDEDGLYADFHALRHSFISNLGRANVPLTMAQKLARHSKPELTSNVYTHIRISDKAAAIGLLPDCPNPSAYAEKGEHSRRIAGADDAGQERTYERRKGEHQGEQWAGETWREPATGGERGTGPISPSDKPQVLTLSRNDNRQQPLAVPGDSEAEGTRTLNHRIDSLADSPFCPLVR